MASPSNGARPSTFLSGPAPPITLNRINFGQTALTEYKGYYAVVLDNVLSREECQTLVAAAQGQTNGVWEPAMVNVGGGRQKVVLDTRNCGRIIWDSPEVAAKIWPGSKIRYLRWRSWSNGRTLQVTVRSREARRGK